jgi:large subunit ribosomal protein L18
MSKIKSKRERRERAKRRKKEKKLGTAERPRLSVFKSSKHIWCQLVDDKEHKTIVSASDLELNLKQKMTKKEIAKEVGKLIAKKALQNNIKKIVFDRSGYKYHGRIKALAEGAREGGLEF